MNLLRRMLFVRDFDFKMLDLTFLIAEYLQHAGIQKPTPMGALTQLWGGTMPEAASLSGEYLVPWARVGPVQEDARDPDVGEQLWRWLEDQVNEAQE